MRSINFTSTMRPPNNVTQESSLQTRGRDWFSSLPLGTRGVFVTCCAIYVGCVLMGYDAFGQVCMAPRWVLYSGGGMGMGMGRMGCGMRGLFDDDGSYVFCLAGMSFSFPPRLIYIVHRADCEVSVAVCVSIPRPHPTERTHARTRFHHMVWASDDFEKRRRRVLR